MTSIPDCSRSRAPVAATAESERIVSLVRTAPLQALARLHVAAASPVVSGDALGRPRIGDEGCSELVDLGPAPPPTVVAARLASLSDVIVAAAGSNRVPAAVVAALVHAEITTVRPFVHGNGLVARAMERALVQALGLDPTGVAVPEAGHVSNGGPATSARSRHTPKEGPPASGCGSRRRARRWSAGLRRGRGSATRCVRDG